MTDLLVAAIAACTALGSPVRGQVLRPAGVVPSDGSVLGEIEDVDLLPDGRVVVLDVQARAVLVYSPRGELLETLGGPGQGPGEIGLSAEVEVGPGGRVMVVDAGNARLTLWGADGELSGSRRLDELVGADPTWPHELLWEDSGLFLKTSSFAPDAPLRVFSLPPDLEGDGRVVATIPVGPTGVTCVFCPMTLGPGGSLVVARGDTMYSIRRLGADGTVAEEWTRDDLPAARRSVEEIQRLDEAARRMTGAEGRGGGPTPFSPFKTRFGPHSLDFDGAGRLWTLPQVEEGRSTVFDVFTASGTRPSSVTLDDPVHRFRIRRNRLVAASETGMGDPVVRVYEILHGGSGVPH